MPFAAIDGIKTHYQVLGSGPPLLMYSPGGFNATVDAWRGQGVYAKVKFLEHLPAKYTCIIFDRRECGRSSGRVERITWTDYVAQGKGLLDHLGIERAHLMGGCMGVSCAAAFASMYPESVQSLVLFWPIGGPKYRVFTQARFATHFAYAAENGLSAVVDLVQKHATSFSGDARAGPWASLIGTDSSFRDTYLKQDLESYKLIVTAIAREMFGPDSVPGPEPEDLMRLDVPGLVIPGRDLFHGTSAAWYLAECLPNADYWDVPPELQTEAVTSERILEFLKNQS